MRSRPTPVSSRRVALALLVLFPLAACGTNAKTTGARQVAASPSAVSSPVAAASDPADPHSLGPVNNLAEARARFNPTNDPSTVITDNGDGTYKIVHTDRIASTDH